MGYALRLLVDPKSMAQSATRADHQFAMAN
jgi:hypothetical protein